MTREYSDARRTFLKSVVLAAGAAVLAPAATKAITANKPELPLQQQQSQGYKETVHISKYYWAARI